jgi:histidinol phosphatase-like enzyme (inositol monophosphatase family)
MMPYMNPTDLLTFAHRLADAASPILNSAFRACGTIPELKSDHSPVTQADRTVEQQLRAMIMAEHPTHGIVGEEYAAHQPDAAYQWILDPIDGTRAFACGIPTYGTLIALKHNAHIVLGIMQQSFLKERFAAVTGQGALHYQDGAASALHSSTCSMLAQARFATTSPYLFSEEQKPRFEAIRHTTAIQNYGGDCYNYAMLAAGHVDVIVEAGLKPYDIAALIPIIQQAGGVITDWEGASLRLDAHSLNIIATANPALHEEALAVIR